MDDNHCLEQQPFSGLSEKEIVVNAGKHVCASGIAKLKSERKRHEKIGGSVKCGKTCPAYMTAIREQKEEAIKITVLYQSVQVGHEMQVGKLRLYQEEIEEI
ncbi:hypothetical protein TNCV_435932 [Trichonephila clavipes]|nr:hypothetical protein TNCV_435932 [Trichonephila clavipes]